MPDLSHGCVFLDGVMYVSVCEETGYTEQQILCLVSVCTLLLGKLKPLTNELFSQDSCCLAAVCAGVTKLYKHIHTLR